MRHAFFKSHPGPIYISEQITYCFHQGEVSTHVYLMFPSKYLHFKACRAWSSRAVQNLAQGFSQTGHIYSRNPHLPIKMACSTSKWGQWPLEGPWGIPRARTVGTKPLVARWEPKGLVPQCPVCGSYEVSYGCFPPARAPWAGKALVGPEMGESIVILGSLKLNFS